MQSTNPGSRIPTSSLLFSVNITVNIGKESVRNVVKRRSATPKHDQQIASCCEMKMSSVAVTPWLLKIYLIRDCGALPY